MPCPMVPAPTTPMVAISVTSRSPMSARKKRTGSLWEAPRRVKEFTVLQSKSEIEDRVAGSGRGGTMPLAAGSLGHIRILGALGSGGMGEVFAGFDETLQRRVALKSIHRRHHLGAGVKARFLREARILSQLDHPNICRIYDYIEGEERDFLVLELFEGETLTSAIAAGMPAALRLEVAEQVARALAAAHQKGVVHRDLKPQNVMLTAEGQVK